jgi:hypothetical protein
MQMRERKYIRFDFTQALHTRSARAQHRDYRIIARTRTIDRSLMRSHGRVAYSIAIARMFRARSTQRKFI